MKAIIIGAGRGQRLMPHTADAPKCFAEVNGKRILDWGLEALRRAGITDVIFIGGYQIDRVRNAYPQFAYCHNQDWMQNNVLLSLMHAIEHMQDGFLCAYSDILYSSEIVQKLVESRDEITIGCDTAWRERYVDRTDHPESDGEKILADGRRVRAVNRTMPGEVARGEFIGVARFNSDGAKMLIDEFHRARRTYGQGPFQAAKSFQKAYLIDLLQEMIEKDIPIHLEETVGGYMEIDTNQDFQLARERWGKEYA